DGLHDRLVGPVQAGRVVGRGERFAVVVPDALAQLEPPGRLALQPPFCRQPRVELAVWVSTRQVVEQVERDADVLGRGAKVWVESGDVAPLRVHAPPPLLGSPPPPRP